MHVKTSTSRKLLRGTAFALSAYILVCAAVRLLVPPSIPPASAFPSAGAVLVSQSEGVRNRILDVKDGRAMAELVLLPGAEGPPFHVHDSFEEVFRVEAGVLRVQLLDGVHEVRAGEVLRVPPGTPHRPFNDGTELVVVRGPDVSIPVVFATCLSQLYGFMDAAPNHRVPPRLLLQLSLMQGYCDTHLVGPLRVVQDGMFLTLAPVARLAGYETYYAEYIPKPGG